MDCNPEEDNEKEKVEEPIPPDKGPSLELPDEPLQLIKLVHNKETGRTVIKLNHGTIERVFKTIGDYPVAVICVCGPSRQGKSFLQCYMIRCLEGLEEGKADWMGWDDRKKPLKGFEFRGGIHPETKGIWVWSRPFIITNRGKKVAVLLLDTQGTYDEFTTNKDMSAIVGLSLLTSSVMIFNSFTNVQEDVLINLNTYIQYGTLALEEGSGTPFQKLNFLVREWNSPSAYPYGGKGGELFLEEKLKLKDNQSQEAIHVRETIQNCFEELDCFLMPSIGEAAKEQNFTGSIDELLPTFAKELENFINNLIVIKGLPAKHIMGSQISASTLKSCLETYVAIFNSDEVPRAETMWQATSQISNNNVTETALKVYETSLKDKLAHSYLQIEELMMEHSHATQLALQHFKQAKKYGSKDTISEFEKKLEANIQHKFSEIKKQNEDKRRGIVALEISNAQSEFRLELRTTFPFEDLDSTKFYTESVIRGAADKTSSTILEQFKAKFSTEPDDKLATLVSLVKENFESCLIAFINQNAANRWSAEREMTVIITELSSDHRLRLESYMSSNEFEEDEAAIQKANESIKTATVQSYQERKKLGGEDFHEEFLLKLHSEMENIFTNLKNQHKLRIQNALQSLKNSIMVYCKHYEAKVKEAEERLDEDLLKNIHSTQEPSYIERFHEEVNPFSKLGPISKKLEMKLKEQLHQVFDKSRSKIAMEKQRCLDSYKKAVEYAFTYFKGKMTSVMYSTALISEEALKAEHNSSKMQAMEEFENFEKFGNPANLSEIKSDLMQKMDAEWAHILNGNRNKWELAISKAEALVSKCKLDYKIFMKTEMSKIESLEQLQSSHEKAKGKAIEKLRQTSPLVGTPKFAESKKELEKKIGEAFEKLKKKEHLALRDTLIEARKSYHDKMGEHCKDHLFMKPSHLKRIHGLVKEAVVKECRKKFQISHFRRLGVEKDLDELFGIYSMKNDMSLNDGDMGLAPAIGIDLGTTHCCVSVSYKGKVHIIPNFEQGSIETTPSYVAFHPDGSETFGETAKSVAYKNPEFTIYDAKRIVGRKITDEELQKDMKLWPFEVKEDGGVPKVAVNGRLLHPEHISGRLLTQCRNMAEAFLKLPPETIKKVVITVPAYFDDGQRQATVDAGKVANLEVLTILNEPTAAAIAYALQRLDKEPRKILIYDLGGGTFDVAVVDIEPKTITVLGVNGNTHLGGNDFDKKMMEYCASVFKDTHKVDLFAGKDSAVKQERDEALRRLARLQMKCEVAKKALSSAHSTVVDADFIINGIDLSVDVTRAKFEEINQAYFDETIQLVEATLKKVELEKEAIDEVVLVGGSSRIPKVQKMLRALFNDEKLLNKTIHPDHAVAYGAAVQAALMNGKQAKGNIDFTKIQDVTPMSLGIEVVTKDLSVILDKNSRIPIKKMKIHYPATDYQTWIRFKVYQGEDLQIAANNKLLGTFDLKGIPPKKTGEEPIDVWMEINAMGILHVRAVCQSTKGENSITVHENKNRMSDETIQRIVEEEAASTKKSKMKAEETSEDDITIMILESMLINVEEYSKHVESFQGPHFTRAHRDIQGDLAVAKSELAELDVTGRSDMEIKKREALIRVDEMTYALAGKVHPDGKICKDCEIDPEE